MERFEDELGLLNISETSVERERKTAIEGVAADELLDKVHFSEIEEIRLQQESRLPTLEVKVNGGWRRMPFESLETARKAFDRLRYRYSSYQENYG